MREDDLHLIHEVLDGEATSEQAALLQRLAANDEELARELQAMRSLNDMLVRVPRAAPPADIVLPALARFDQLFPASAVIGGRAAAGKAAGIRETGVAAGASLISSCWNTLKELIIMAETTTGILGSTRAKVFAGSAIAAVLVYAVSTSIDAPADPKGVAGTIAPAQRAQAPQIATADVKLGDQSAAQLMQTDEYRALVNSDAFKEVMKSDASRVFLASDAFKEVMKNDASRVFLASDAFREVMKTDALRVVLASDAASADVFKSDAYKEAMKSDAFKEAMKSDAFRMALSSDAFRMLLKSDAFKEAMKSDGFKEAMKSDAFRTVLKSDANLRMLKSDAFREALKSDAFRAQKVDAGKIDAGKTSAGKTDAGKTSN